MILSPAELAELRAVEEGEMVDTFTAYSPAWTKVDGFDVEEWVEQYVTPGMVAGLSAQSDRATARTETVGSVERDVIEGGLRQPLSQPVPAKGWELECTAVGTDSNPALLGRRWRVASVPVRSLATARRLDVVDLQED